jgi:hypothetical protein
LRFAVTACRQRQRNPSVPLISGTPIPSLYSIAYDAGCILRSLFFSGT